MRPRALVYLYVRRLRVHVVQELIAGLGVAIAVALVFAVVAANGSISGSASEVVHAVVGPANLQLRARNGDGFDERLLTRVEHLAGVKQAAPLLERTATIVVPGTGGRSATVDLAGTDISLALLNGLAHTLPLAALSPGGIGLSRASATTLGITPASTLVGVARKVLLKLRGSAHPLRVTAVLGPETFGALAQAQVAVMPLSRLQRLAGLQGRVTRILVQSDPGRETAVRAELQTLAAGGLTVAPSDQDVTLLHQALGPSKQASELFAAISALLGVLFAFTAMLLTVPERRQQIASLRMLGVRRSAITQMLVFQALCLGLVASFVGVLVGYELSRGVFHQSPGYLSQAFTLGTSTVVGVTPLLLALLGGILATCLASMVSLVDLRRGQPLNAVYFEGGVPGNALGTGAQRKLFVAALCLIALASVLFVLVPSAAILACVLLALATVLAVPVVFWGVLRAARLLAERSGGKLSILLVALTSLKATTLRSLALAATGAVALFGSVALGGSRDDLLRGISRYTSHYVSAADIWLVNPQDNQAINDFLPDHNTARVTRLPAVASVHAFQGSFFDFGDRRVWLIAWPPDTRAGLLQDQVIGGDPVLAAARLREGGWITVSAQVAAEHHVGVGDILVLPTPAGSIGFRVAATTTNFGWSPGAILMSTTDYGRAWATSAPTALGVDLAPGANAPAALAAVGRALGPASGLEALTAQTREAAIDASASEGLSQLGEISTLLVIAAILAMAAALGSSIWQRRVSLAGLRLQGARPPRLRRILMSEAALMLFAGCLTGAVAGIYGQVVIDGYLKHVTNFPVASVATGQRPFEIFAIAVAAALLVAAVPGWFASRVSPTVALDA